MPSNFELANPTEFELNRNHIIQAKNLFWYGQLSTIIIGPNFAYIEKYSNAARSANNMVKIFSKPLNLPINYIPYQTPSEFKSVIFREVFSGKSISNQTANRQWLIIQTNAEIVKTLNKTFKNLGRGLDILLILDKNAKKLLPSSEKATVLDLANVTAKTSLECYTKWEMAAATACLVDATLIFGSTVLGIKISPVVLAASSLVATYCITKYTWEQIGQPAIDFTWNEVLPMASESFQETIKNNGLTSNILMDTVILTGLKLGKKYGGVIFENLSNYSTNFYNNYLSNVVNSFSRLSFSEIKANDFLINQPLPTLQKNTFSYHSIKYLYFDLMNSRKLHNSFYTPVDLAINKMPKNAEILFKNLNTSFSTQASTSDFNTNENRLNSNEISRTTILVNPNQVAPQINENSSIDFFLDIIRPGNLKNQTGLKVGYSSSHGFGHYRDSSGNEVRFSLFTLGVRSLPFIPSIAISIPIEITAAALTAATAITIPATIIGYGIKKLIDYSHWKNLPSTIKTEENLYLALEEYKSAINKDWNWLLKPKSYFQSNKEWKTNRRKNFISSLNEYVKTHTNQQATTLLLSCTKELKLKEINAIFKEGMQSSKTEDEKNNYKNALHAHLWKTAVSEPNRTTLSELRHFTLNEYSGKTKEIVSDEFVQTFLYDFSNNKLINSDELIVKNLHQAEKQSEKCLSNEYQTLLGLSLYNLGINQLKDDGKKHLNESYHRLSTLKETNSLTRIFSNLAALQLDEVKPLFNIQLELHEELKTFENKIIQQQHFNDDEKKLFTVISNGLAFIAEKNNNLEERLSILNSIKAHGIINDQLYLDLAIANYYQMIKFDNIEKATIFNENPQDAVILEANIIQSAQTALNYFSKLPKNILNDESIKMISNHVRLKTNNQNNCEIAKNELNQIFNNYRSKIEKGLDLSNQQHENAISSSWLLANAFEQLKNHEQVIATLQNAKKLFASNEEIIAFDRSLFYAFYQKARHHLENSFHESENNNDQSAAIEKEKAERAFFECKNIYDKRSNNFTNDDEILFCQSHAMLATGQLKLAELGFQQLLDRNQKNSPNYEEQINNRKKNYVIKALIGLSETKLQKMQNIEDKTLWEKLFNTNKKIKLELLTSAIQDKEFPKEYSLIIAELKKLAQLYEIAGDLNVGKLTQINYHSAQYYSEQIVNSDNASANDVIALARVLCKQQKFDSATDVLNNASARFPNEAGNLKDINQAIEVFTNNELCYFVFSTISIFSSHLAREFLNNSESSDLVKMASKVFLTTAFFTDLALKVSQTKNYTNLYNQLSQQNKTKEEESIVKLLKLNYKNPLVLTQTLCSAVNIIRMWRIEDNKNPEEYIKKNIEKMIYDVADITGDVLSTALDIKQLLTNDTGILNSFDDYTAAFANLSIFMRHIGNQLQNKRKNRELIYEHQLVRLIEDVTTWGPLITSIVIAAAKNETIRNIVIKASLKAIQKFLGLGWIGQLFVITGGVIVVGVTVYKVKKHYDRKTLEAIKYNIDVMTHEKVFALSDKLIKLQNQLELNPNDPNLLATIENLNHQIIENLQSVVDKCKTYLAEQPDNREIQETYSRIKRQLAIREGHYQTVINECNLILNQPNRDIVSQEQLEELKSTRAECYYLLKDFFSAKEDFLMLMNTASANERLASIALYRGDTSTAITHYENAIEILRKKLVDANKSLQVIDQNRYKFGGFVEKLYSFEKSLRLILKISLMNDSKFLGTKLYEQRSKQITSLNDQINELKNNIETVRSEINLIWDSAQRQIYGELISSIISAIFNNYHAIQSIITLTPEQIPSLDSGPRNPKVSSLPTCTTSFFGQSTTKKQLNTISPSNYATTSNLGKSSMFSEVIKKKLIKQQSLNQFKNAIN